ncbi:hydrolase [Pilimelia anulata]|uniref:Hydrolase n=1 Tax=Pilimelia anulata TaxID=53371 RepID=A0A8J3B1Q7_9ACTN|nr:HAD-IA family hydrolase [Pilimelia anulata]GGJ89057.1 hydrolase [Pilimelia anulata]
MTTDDLAELLARARVLLLDFDGPICSLFARHSAPSVADRLRGILEQHGVKIPTDLREVRDPLAVLRFSDGTAAQYPVEEAQVAAEVLAAATAEPTPGAAEVIAKASRTGRLLAVVSNNSAAAVDSYLDRMNLAGAFSAVVGRPAREPRWMKPHPQAVLSALRALDVGPEGALMVGDAATDVLAAHSAGVPVVGYASRLNKYEALAEADVIVTSMVAIANAL